jgi:hypothetical protein
MPAAAQDLDAIPWKLLVQIGHHAAEEDAEVLAQPRSII